MIRQSGTRVSPALLCGVILLSGCEAPPTQLVVRVDSDFVAPGHLQRIEIRVTDPAWPDEMPEVHTVYPNGDLTEGRVDLPFSFGVTPGSSGPDSDVLVELRGLSGPGRPPAGQLLVTTGARAAFVGHKTLLLRMFIFSECQGVSCLEGETCGMEEGEPTCVLEQREGLPEIRPGTELDAGLDGGRRPTVDGAAPRDASADGGGPDSATTDSGPDDSGVDAAGTDAGPCTADCGGTCVAGVCTFDNPASAVECPSVGACEVNCIASETCAVAISCGAGRCSINCEGAGSCRGPISCGDTERCEISCLGRSSCRGSISCDRSRSCAVTCAGAESCARAITCSDGQPCSIQCLAENSCRLGFDCEASCGCDASCATDACPSGSWLCPPRCDAGRGCEPGGLPGCEYTC